MRLGNASIVHSLAHMLNETAIYDILDCDDHVVVEVEYEEGFPNEHDELVNMWTVSFNGDVWAEFWAKPTDRQIRKLRKEFRKECRYDSW
ncbi:hypothetical protein NVP1244A_099 [Vibrio phage 1.244.A._10N.261.54.C3]|nr:hypothetical protein NVP1244A_099 [Vibrio phage 1.244.A._10N.261.54.C3]AUR98727.1 hypothetical protein NVP1255O_099 [Vibrio phage 1.255.O._10N.286.45.F1]